jgi:hypothetical protein
MQAGIFPTASDTNKKEFQSFLLQKSILSQNARKGHNCPACRPQKGEIPRKAEKYQTFATITRTTSSQALSATETIDFCRYKVYHNKASGHGCLIMILGTAKGTADGKQQ